jgi:hypothetical protein
LSTATKHNLLHLVSSKKTSCLEPQPQKLQAEHQSTMLTPNVTSLLALPIRAPGTALS